MRSADIEAELPRLLAFAKIVTLDRPWAEAAARDWLEAAASSTVLVRARDNQDLYRHLAARIASGDATPRRTARRGDPLNRSALQRLSPRERGVAFLCQMVGLSPVDAGEVMDFGYQMALRRQPLAAEHSHLA